MPEISDLEHFSKNLKKDLLNKKINHIEIYKEKRMKPSSDAIIKNLQNQVIKDIKRSGKEIVISLSNEHSISIHLMLKGEFFIEEIFHQKKETILKMDLEDTTFWIEDSKYLTTVELDKEEMVPDVLANNFTLEYFLAQVQKNQRKNGKAFLIDQSIMRGIGNAYADEILYATKIHPASILIKVEEKKLKELYGNISKVILDSLQKLEELTPNAIRGEERSFLKVHRKDIQIAENGETIVIEKIAGKDTYFVASQEVIK